MKNWKTTSAGILSIVAGLVRIIFALKAGNFSEEAIMTSVTTIVTGLGLLFAKDGNVTGVGEDAVTLKEIKKVEAAITKSGGLQVDDITPNPKDGN